MDTTSPPPRRPHPLAILHDPRTIRLRCRSVMQAVRDNLSPSFRVDLDALPALADRVAALTRERHPTLVVPWHSLWRHLEAGGQDRKAELDALLAGRDPQAVARVQMDLVVVSALLAARVTTNWRYVEGQPLATGARPTASADELLASLNEAAAPAADAAMVPDAAPAPDAPASLSTQEFAHSEGIAVACFRAFLAGAFSARTSDPLRADAAALRHMDAAALRALFQSGAANAMNGLDGRAALLARLGVVLADEAAADSRLGRSAEARPALLLDRITAHDSRHSVSAGDVLAEVLRVVAPLSARGPRIRGALAGDVGAHRWAGDATAGGGRDATTGGWVPLHGPAQWASHSLLEPLQWAGVDVTDLDADTAEAGLTGVPDLRLLGLFIDSDVLLPRSPSLLERAHKPEDESLVEARALTVCLLDDLAAAVRQRLARSAAELPLGRLLHGGIWPAAREQARKRRRDGSPPLRAESDGSLL